MQGFVSHIMDNENPLPAFDDIDESHEQDSCKNHDKVTRAQTMIKSQKVRQEKKTDKGEG